MSPARSGARPTTTPPQVRQADYLAFESGTVLNKVFGSSLKSFVASLARGGALRDGELDELQQYLEEMKRGDRP